MSVRFTQFVAVSLFGWFTFICATWIVQKQNGHRAKAEDTSCNAHQVIARLQDIREEYGEANESVYPESSQKVEAMANAEMTAALTMPCMKPYAPELRAIMDGIAARVQPIVIDNATDSLMARIPADLHLRRAPIVMPDMKHGKQVFEANCAACHGAAGRPSQAMIHALEMPPADLLDPAVMNPLSPYRVYNAVTYGVRATPMTPHKNLSETDRWAVSFFVFSLRHTTCDATRPMMSIEDLSVASDNDLVARFGEAPLACLRR